MSTDFFALKTFCIWASHRRYKEAADYLHVTAIRCLRCMRRRPEDGSSGASGENLTLDTRVRKAGRDPSEPFAFNGEIDRSRPKAVTRWRVKSGGCWIN